ncbi:MAG: competence/damage-inducible protein A [Actinomycetota bacterium]|nr:competence/damage-inducible protein A [Actinomycetota bacterium]
MIVELISVGTELLLGEVVNTNATFIGQRLAEVGFDHYRQVVVGDNLPRLTEAIEAALQRADAVVLTGGLGPTQDDLTREAVAAATGRAMSFSRSWEQELRRRWATLGRDMPETNLRQAEYPEGAELIPNPKGTAPGLALEVDGKHIFALPGVPEEMVPMFDAHVIPTLAAAAGEGGVLVSRVIRTWGMSESQVAEVLDHLFWGSTNPTVAFLASAGEIKVRLSAKAGAAERAAELIRPVEEEVRLHLGQAVFGADEETVESVVLGLLQERGWRLAVAESATGGLIAARLTAVPGASKTVLGGVVAYNSDLKRELLGVPAELLTTEGVVSEATARAMAVGAAERLGAEVSVAVTGSAGPDPLEEPAGTMVVAVRTPEAVGTRTLRLPGDRERVRSYTTTAALHLLRLAVAGQWWSE